MKDGYDFDRDANVLTAIISGALVFIGAAVAFLILSVAAVVVWWLA